MIVRVGTPGTCRICQARPRRIKAAAARPLETLIAFLVLIDPRKNTTRLYMVAVTPMLSANARSGASGATSARRAPCEAGNFATNARRAERRSIRLRERRGDERQAHFWLFLVSSANFSAWLSSPAPALPMISRRSVKEWRSCAASELKR